jgi:phosphatidylserine/phosphatidylglycerophosphate/cardiolipin synthase-like enzyme
MYENGQPSLSIDRPSYPPRSRAQHRGVRDLLAALVVVALYPQPAGAQSQDDLCLGQPLSAPAVAVAATLERSKLTQISSCNHFVVGPVPPKDYFMQIVDDYPVDWENYHLAVKDLLVGTRSTFSLSRLWLNTELLDVLADGLCELHAALGQLPGRLQKPIVRFHFSNPSDPAGPHTELAWDLLTAGVAAGCLPEDEDLWNFHLAVRTASTFPLNAHYNHSKLSTSDDDRAISGSVETYSPELAVAVRGPAARQAQDLFEAVWGQFHFAEWCKATDGSLCFPRNGWELMVPPSTTSTHFPGTNVFSLARHRRVPLADTSSDKAIYAAIDAAEESLFVSQPSLSWILFGVVDALVDRIAEAAARGADVRIAIGDDVGVSIDDQVNEVFERASSVIGELAPTFLDQQLAFCRLKVASHPGGPGGPDSHAKSFSVGRALFYIGSQNFYPTGFGGGVANLSEHGFLVDGYGASAHLADRYHDEYAVPTWDDAKADGMYVQGGCEAITYPTRLVASASTGDGCDITFDTTFDLLMFDLDMLARFEGHGTCMSNGHMVAITIGGEVPITGDPTTFGVIQNGYIAGVVDDPPVSDMVPLQGTFKVDGEYMSQLDAHFEGLTLGVSYEGDVFRD